MPYVIERWLGGTLTNFRTIRDRLKRLEELERLNETGEIATYSKKMKAQLDRETAKIKRNLQGIRTMAKLPGAMFIIDVNREINAVLAAPEVRARIVGAGEIVLGGTPEALAKRMQSDYERYGAIVKELNISAD